MNYKTFVKLGNKSFNITKVDFLEFDEDELTVSVYINYETMKFKFKKEEQFNRFVSYVKLYSTEFDCDVERVDESEKKEKEILKS